MEIKNLFEDKVFTVSNFLTVMRIAAVPFVLYHMYAESVTQRSEHRTYQLVFFSVIVITDFLDGFIARSFNQISKLGQFLDPLSDKICLLSIGGALVFFKAYPGWVFLVALLREIIVLVLSVFLYSRRSVEVRPNIFGKFGVAAMALSAFIYIADFNCCIFYEFFSIKVISAYLILLFYIIGSIFYVKDYFRHCITA